VIVKLLTVEAGVFIYTTFKNTIFASQAERCVSILQTNWLMLFWEEVAVSSCKQTKPKNYEISYLISNGKYSNHCTLKS
jgi:hypothetical protein